MAGLSRPPAPFTVVYGAESYFLDVAIMDARQWKGRAVTMLDASEGLDEQELLNILNTPDYENRPRTVIIEEAQKVKESKEKLFREYVNVKRPNDLSVVLVAIVRSDKLPDIWRVAVSKLPESAKREALREHPKLKTYSTKNEVHAFILNEAARMGLKLEVGVETSLCLLTGGSLHRIMNELRKFQTFLGDGKQLVEMKHLKLVTAHSYSVEPYAVVEAAFNKETLKAMNNLSLLYRSTDEDPEVRVTSGLMRQLQKVIVARSLLDKGSSDGDIAAAFEMNAWACSKFFIPMVRKHSLASLASHMSRLCKLELDVKGSSRSKRTLVELAVLSIAG